MVININSVPVSTVAKSTVVNQRWFTFGDSKNIYILIAGHLYSLRHSGGGAGTGLFTINHPNTYFEKFRYVFIEEVNAREMGQT